MTTPSGEVRKAEYKRTKMISLIAGLLTAATPGIYGAWQAAKAELKTRQEEVVRDKQEGDLQKNVRALQIAVAALQKSAVTHRDLVDLIVKLREHQDHHQPRRGRRPTPAATERERELERKLIELKKQAASAAQASKKAAAASKAAPRLQPAKHIRKLVQQANGF